MFSSFRMFYMTFLTLLSLGYSEEYPEDWHPFAINLTTYQYSNCTGDFTVTVNQSDGVCIGNPYPYLPCCKRVEMTYHPTLFGECNGWGQVYTCHCDWIPPQPSPHSDSQPNQDDMLAYILIPVLVVFFGMWLIYHYRNKTHQGYEVIHSPPVIRVTSV
jgi:hypothetical protein